LPIGIVNERLVHRIAEVNLPTKYGEFTGIAYKSDIDPDEHLALVMGDTSTEEPVLARAHSECVAGDVFGSLRCDCGEQVSMAMKSIAGEGRGVFLYMRQEGRGIGFADLRDCGVGAQILAELGLHQIRLLTNNPRKVIGLEAYGLKVVETVPIIVRPSWYNRHYLETKKEKPGHLLA